MCINFVNLYRKKKNMFYITQGNIFWKQCHHVKTNFNLFLS